MFSFRWMVIPIAIGSVNGMFGIEKPTRPASRKFKSLGTEIVKHDHHGGPVPNAAGLKSRGMIGAMPPAARNLEASEE